MVARSQLYVPGDAPDKLAGALRRGADAVIADLEDAVAVAAKGRARAAVAAWLAGLPPAGAGVEAWVRINPGPLGHADVRAVTCPALRGVCVAKTGGVDQLRAVDAVLAEAEAAAGMARGSVAVLPLLEGAGAVLAAPAIARGPRVTRLQVGEADLRAELGVDPGPDERELLWVRSQVVLASAAAGIEPPVGPVSTDFRDLDALRRSTEALRRLGYAGRACIHPAQVTVVNEVFTPAPDEVERARDVVARFEAAAAAGSGVCTDAAGRMIDEAVVRQARRVLDAAR
jgi:citrate lyase subunit beta/citryl-CoA lyase